MTSEKMSALCLCPTWLCRPVWPLFVMLVTFPSVFHCTDNPPAPEKMFPRGNHWAVGHLMGKKSAGSLPELLDANTDDPASSEMSELLTIKHLLEALMLQKTHRGTTTASDKRQRWLRSGWREKDKDDYLQEMSDLVLLVMKLRERDSTSVPEED